MTRPNSTFGLRQTAASDRIWRTGQSIDNRSFTQCAWIHLRSRAGNTATILAVNAAASGFYTEIGTLAAPLQFYNDTTGFVNVGVDYDSTPDRWVFLAQTSSAAAHKCYVFDNGHFQEFANSSPAPALTMTEYGWLNETDNQAADGEAACMRFWNRPLTAAELRVEMLSMDAVSRRGLLCEDRKSTRLNSSHLGISRMPSSA